LPEKEPLVGGTFATGEVTSGAFVVTQFWAAVMAVAPEESVGRFWAPITAQIAAIF